MSAIRTLIALASLAAAALPAAAQDKIIWKGERAPTEGTVISINYREIKYRLSTAGGEQEDFSKDVKDIEFDSDNTFSYEYTQGRNALHKGAYKEAVEQFERAITRIKQSNTPNHPMRDFCRKYILEAHLAAGNLADVVAAARELRKEKPDTFFLRDSFLMQYEAAKRKPDSALQDDTIKAIDEVIKADRRYADLQRDADLLRADMMESGKEHLKALGVYTKLAEHKDLWEEVSLGILRCQSALGKTADLKAKVESLLSDMKDRRDTNPRVYLGAIIGRGDVYLAEGKIKEALLDYMKGALDPGSAGRTYEHETAIAKAAMAAARYGKQFGEKDKTNKNLYIDRAKELREELKRTFPQTAWMALVNAAIEDAIRGQ
jgi:tetratricopeptide (TPR) repeat protein